MNIEFLCVFMTLGLSSIIKVQSLGGYKMQTLKIFAKVR